MRKICKACDQMSSVAYVERAAWWSRELTRFRARGPGDTENAMRAIERDYGIDYWLIWRLRYRKSQCKSICAAIYHHLEAAYQNECDRQRAKLEHELAITRAKVGPRNAAVVAAAAVVDEAQAGQGNPSSLVERYED